MTIGSGTTAGAGVWSKLAAFVTIRAGVLPPSQRCSLSVAALHPAVGTISALRRDHDIDMLPAVNIGLELQAITSAAAELYTGMP